MVKKVVLVMEQLLLRGIASWRITHALVYEYGPADIFLKLRELSGVEVDVFGGARTTNVFTPLFCFACTSIYASALCAVLPKWLIMPFTISGLAMLMERLNGYLQSKDTPTTG